MSKFQGRQGQLRRAERNRTRAVTVAERTGAVPVRGDRQRIEWHLVAPSGATFCRVSPERWTEDFRLDLRPRPEDVCVTCRLGFAQAFSQFERLSATDHAREITEALDWLREYEGRSAS